MTSADIPLSKPEFPYQRVSSPRLLFYQTCSLHSDPAFPSIQNPIILRSLDTLSTLYSPNYEYFANAIHRREREREKKVISKLRRYSKMGIYKFPVGSNAKRILSERQTEATARMSSNPLKDGCIWHGRSLVGKSHGFPEVRHAPRVSGRGDRKWSGGRGRRPPISLLN